MQAILFVDIVGSSALYQNEGDADALKVIGAQIALFEDIVSDYYGKTVKKIGDAILAQFDSSEQACLAAMQMRRFALMKDNDLFEGNPLQIKAGLHYGPVVEKDGDVFGNTVNVASRVTAAAGPQQVLITQQVLSSLPDEMKELARFIEKTTFKGINEEYEVFEIVMNEDSEGLTTSVTEHDEAHLVFSTLSVTYQFKKTDFPASKGAITIGRDETNDIVVQALDASRHHAKIEARKGKFVLKDTSVNGTYLQNAAGQCFKVHREEMTLMGEGMILLGKATDEGKNAIRFICH